MSVFPKLTSVDAHSSATRPLASAVLGGGTPRKALLALLFAPLLFGFLSYAISAALGMTTLGNPLATSAALIRRLMIPNERSDSWEPMIQALALLHGAHGGSLYDILFFQRHEKFQYAPTSLVWLEGIKYFAPLTPAGLNRINAVAFIVNSISGAFLIRVCTRDKWSIAAEENRNFLTVVALLLPFVYWPTVYGFTVGQIQVWINLLATLAVLFWCLDRKIGCGIALGLACTIKPQLGLFLLWGLVWREWRLTAAMAATAALFGLISVLMYGLANHLGFIEVLAYIARHGESFRANQSVNGLLNRLLFVGNNTDWDGANFAPYNPIVRWGTLLSGLVLMVIPLALSRADGGRRASAFDLCFAIVCFTMASPVAWEHHYGLALPAYILALGRFASVTGVPRRIAVGLAMSWLLVGSNLQITNVFSGTYFNPVQSYVFIGGVILLLCLTGIRRSAMTA